MTRAVLFSLVLSLALGFAVHRQAQATIMTSGCTANPNVSCTLDELVNGGASFTLNDEKTFQNFRNLGSQDFGGALLNPALFALELKDDGGLDPGPGFTFDWSGFPLAANTQTNSAPIAFLEFDFDLVVQDPELRLSDMSISSGDFSDCATSSFDSFCTIAYSLQAIGITTITAFHESEGNAVQTAATNQSALFTPTLSATFRVSTTAICNGLEVSPDIIACNYNNRSVTYRFSQTEVELPPDPEDPIDPVGAIPEPGSLFLFGAGLTALTWVRRRRRR